MIRLPYDYSRCVPSQDCGQRATCARANCWPPESYGNTSVVDASVTIGRPGWCPMFIDMRGPEVQRK